MRDIRCRGKSIYTDEWITGYYIGTGTLCKYGDEHWYVDDETVGQFTGKVDKNGTKIFEGDIFQLEDDVVAVVVFSDGCFRLEEYGLCGTWTESGYDECGGGYGIIECSPIDWYFLKDMEVIGNIHDNPELIPC